MAASATRVAIAKIKNRKVAVQVSVSETFADIFTKAVDIAGFKHSVKDIKSIYIYENQNKTNTPVEDGILVGQSMSCHMLADLNCRFVEFVFSESLDLNNNNITEENAFSLLMKKSYRLPDRPKPQKEGKLTAPSLKVYEGACEETIEADLDLVKLATNSPGPSFSTKSKSRDFQTCLPFQEFLKAHSLSGHYSFQIMKCEEEDCAYCSLNPIRDQELFSRLSFLPEPKPDDTGKHYLPFREVYGKSHTVDKYRPSGKHGNFEDDIIEEDKTNREILKAQKVRDVIKCGECNKPRLVYCNSRTERVQDAYLLRLKEDRLYKCGDQLEESSGLVMQRALNCTSDIEIPYYSPNCSRWVVAVCCYCGSQDNLMDDNEPYIQDLYTKFSKVRPLCKPCHSRGKDAKTWGQKFVKKESEQKLEFDFDSK